MDLHGGAIRQLLDCEVKKVLQNLMDPDTDHKAVREVNLKIAMKTNFERDSLDIGMQAKSKFAPDRAVTCHAYLGQKSGKAYLSDQYNGRQTDIEDRVPSKKKQLPVEDVLGDALPIEINH